MPIAKPVDTKVMAKLKRLVNSCGELWAILFS